MRPTTERVFVPGPAGRIECALDKPDPGRTEQQARGSALIAHPHPLFGGTLDNKVVQTLARAFVELGYEAWRPNFRGVGQSEGRYDEGRGEVDDLAAVFHALKSPTVVLAGFSFGAAMQARLAETLGKENRFKPERLVLVGIAVVHFETPPVPAGTLVIHGERDETVPLAAVLDWARPQDLPVVVVPGAEHFFHHKLPLLRSIVESSWK
jgi:alpha/beta superfamily hydrolase